MNPILTAPSNGVKLASIPLLLVVLAVTPFVAVTPALAGAPPDGEQRLESVEFVLVPHVHAEGESHD